jgi:hypothetical protein
MSFLRSKTTTTPGNQFAGWVKDKFSPQVDQGIAGGNILSSLLTGQGDTAGADAAWSRFKDQAGYAPAMRDMSRGVVGQGAASGILNSGATAGRLQSRGAELNRNMYGNFLEQLRGLMGSGQQAGQLVSGAGGQNSQQQQSTGSKILSGVGGLLGVFSDPRCKRDIEKLTEFSDGLGVYRFRYRDDDELRIGVMACGGPDSVEAIRPWAMGPVVGGFRTVNYAAL